MKILVKCSFIIPIEVDDDYYDDEHSMEFDIEENHCPGTGLVGAAFDKIYEESEKNSVCWACKLNGENEIISIEK